MEQSKKKFLDVYPHCIDCPVHEYCGTVVSSYRLCNSYRKVK